MVRKVFTTKEEFNTTAQSLGISLPVCEDIDILKTASTVGDKTIANRLVCQAMEGCDGTPDGRPDELTLRRYRRFAEGGAGLIWGEATAVLPEGRANPRQLYIHADTLDAFKR